MATLATPVIAYFLIPNPNAWIVTAILAVLIYWRHRANIQRILAGTELKIGSKKQWRHAADGKLIPFGELKGRSEFAFDDPHLPDCIFTNLKDATVSFGPRSGEENLTVKVGEEPIPDAWTTVVTWTPDAEAPFYCVEPWMGPPNSPEHKNGLRFAEPGQVDTFVTEVSLM